MPRKKDKLPHKIKYRHRDVRITRKKSDLGVDDATEASGIFSNNSRAIYIDPTDTNHAQVISVLHELVHLILDDGGVSVRLKLEEQLADTISVGLAELLVRNPKLFPLLRQMVTERGT